MVIVNVPVPVFPPKPPNKTADAIAPASDFDCSVSNVPPIILSTPRIFAISSFVNSSNLSKAPAFFNRILVLSTS